MTTTEITTSAINIVLREDGIVEFYAKPDKTDIITLDEIKEVNEKVRSFKESHRLYLILFKNGKFTGEARKFLASQSEVADKVAMVAKTPIQKVVGNFFLGLNKPDINIKLFSSQGRAEQWLLL